MRISDWSSTCALPILTGVTHDMSVMTEESFGPVVGIMKVASDEEAVRLMNDSAYGLTASIWTADLAAAEAIGGEIDRKSAVSGTSVSVRVDLGGRGRIKTKNQTNTQSEPRSIN